MYKKIITILTILTTSYFSFANDWQDTLDLIELNDKIQLVNEYKENDLNIKQMILLNNLNYSFERSLQLQTVNTFVNDYVYKIIMFKPRIFVNFYAADRATYYFYKKTEYENAVGLEKYDILKNFDR